MSIKIIRTAFVFTTTFSFFLVMWLFMTTQTNAWYQTTYPVTVYYDVTTTESKQVAVECTWDFYRDIMNTPEPYYSTVFKFCIGGGGFGYPSCGSTGVAGDSGKNLYRNSCDSSWGWCDNVGKPYPGVDYYKTVYYDVTVTKSKEVTKYVCHYLGVDSWNACTLSNTQTSNRSWKTKTADSPWNSSNCVDGPSVQSCCITPTVSITGPSNVDVETDFNLNWSFYKTGNYTCNITNTDNYDPSFPQVVPTPGSNGITISDIAVGNLTYAGSYENYPHTYKISCNNSAPRCTNVENTHQLTANPIPLNATLQVKDAGGVSYPDDATIQVTDMLAYTVQVSDGVPFETDGEYKVTWKWYVDGVLYDTVTGRTSGQSHSVDKRITIVSSDGVTPNIGVEVTATDQWNKSKTITRGFVGIDDRNPQ